MTANGAKGVIANIPSVTDIPYFTTVPYNAVPLDAATAAALNQSLYGPLKQVLTAFGQGSRINLVSAGNNPILIFDKDITDMKAQITGGLMAAGVDASTAGALGTYFGQGTPGNFQRSYRANSFFCYRKESCRQPSPFDKLGSHFLWMTNMY